MAQDHRVHDGYSTKRYDDAARAAVRPGCILAVGHQEYFLIVEHLGDDRWQTIPIDSHNIQCIIGTKSCARREMDLATLRNLHVFPNTGVGPQHHLHGNGRDDGGAR